MKILNFFGHLLTIACITSLAGVGVSLATDPLLMPDYSKCMVGICHKCDRPNAKCTCQDESDPSPEPPKNPAKFVGDLVKNTAGSDGSGLNVQTCVEIMARHQGVSELHGFQDWCKKRPGGSWPDKNARQIGEFCREREHGVPSYIQRETKDLVLVEALVLNGRWVMISDMAGPTTPYKAKAAAASIVIYMDKNRACLIDPNWVGTKDQFQWVTRAELAERYGGWTFAFCD